MKLKLLILALTISACASEDSSNDSAAKPETRNLSGGTSSGGDQPFGFSLECTDEGRSVVVTVTDSSNGSGTIEVTDTSSGNSKLIDVTSHLFRYFVADVGTEEFFVRYKPMSDLDVLVLLDIQLETTNSGPSKAYTATWYGTANLPVNRQVTLSCEKKSV